MAQSRDGLSLSVLSPCLLLVCWEKGKERGRVRNEEEEEVAGDWTWSLHTQLKESFAQRHRLPTYVLTFVFLSVVIYTTMELKAKFATAQHQRPHSNFGLARTVGEDQWPVSCSVAFIKTCCYISLGLVAFYDRWAGNNELPNILFQAFCLPNMTKDCIRLCRCLLLFAH